MSKFVVQLVFTYRSMEVIVEYFILKAEN